MSYNYNVYLSKCGKSEKSLFTFVGVPSDAEYFSVFKSTDTSQRVYVYFGDDEDLDDPAPGGTGLWVDTSTYITKQQCADRSRDLLNENDFICSSSTATDPILTVYYKKPLNTQDGTENTATAITLGTKTDGSIADPSSGPEQGVEGIDWVHFTCKTYQKTMMVRNSKMHLVGRTSFRIPLGKIQWGLVLKDCVILDEGDPNNLSASSSHLAVSRFCNDANTIGGYFNVYAFIYSPFLDGNLVVFFDNNSAPQIYYRCTIDGSKFTFDARKLQLVGNIKLDECWTGS